MASPQHKAAVIGISRGMRTKNFIVEFSKTPPQHLVANKTTLPAPSPAAGSSTLLGFPDLCIFGWPFPDLAPTLTPSSHQPSN